MSAFASKTAAHRQIAGPSMPAVCMICRTVLTRQPRSKVKLSAVTPAQAPAKACKSRISYHTGECTWLNFVSLPLSIAGSRITA